MRAPAIVWLAQALWQQGHSGFQRTESQSKVGQNISLAFVKIHFLRLKCREFFPTQKGEPVNQKKLRGEDEHWRPLFKRSLFNIDRRPTIGHKTKPQFVMLKYL